MKPAGPTRVLNPMGRAARLCLFLGFFGLILLLIWPEDILPAPTLLGIAPFLVLAGLLVGWCYPLLRGRGEAQDRSLFASELADLLEMGFTLPEAVTRLEEVNRSQFSTRYTSMAQAMTLLRGRLEFGESFAGSVRNLSFFPSYWERLLSVSDRSAIPLPRVLQEIAELESSPELDTQPSTNLYTLGMTWLVGLFCVTYIMPTFITLYEGLNLQVPWLTRLVISTFRLLRQPLFWVPLVSLLFLSRFQPQIRRNLSNWWQQLPWQWPVTRQREQARLAGLWSACLGLGADQGQALNAGAALTESPRYRAYLQSRADSSDRLSQVCRARPDLFDAAFSWLIVEGERFENLPGSLALAAESYSHAARTGEARRREQTRVAGTLAVGLLVGLFCVSVFTPLYELLAALSGGSL